MPQPSGKSNETQPRSSRKTEETQSAQSASDLVIEGTSSPAKTPTLAVGKKAPLFALPGTTGETVRLKDYQGPQGKNVVLYFYPKDNTPGCTQEACDFREQLPQLTSSGTIVLGISGDSLKSHEKFAGKYELPFPLLADEDHAVAETYGVWVEKKNYGKTYMGIQRSTFLIDRAGKLTAIWRNVKVKGHVAEVLERLAELSH